MRVPALELHLHKVRDDVSHQALAAVRAADGHAAQRVFKQGARGDHPPVRVVDGGGVGQIAVSGDALGLEQRIHLGLRAAVAGRNGDGGVFAHVILLCFWVTHLL